MPGAWAGERPYYITYSIIYTYIYESICSSGSMENIRIITGMTTSVPEFPGVFTPLASWSPNPVFLRLLLISGIGISGCITLPCPFTNCFSTEFRFDVGLNPLWYSSKGFTIEIILNKTKWAFFKNDREVCMAHIFSWFHKRHSFRWRCGWWFWRQRMRGSTCTIIESLTFKYHFIRNCE